MNKQKYHTAYSSQDAIMLIYPDDINNDNEITFPYKLTKEKFSKFGNRYIVILKVIVELEYEIFEEPEI